MFVFTNDIYRIVDDNLSSSNFTLITSLITSSHQWEWTPHFIKQRIKQTNQLNQNRSSIKKPNNNNDKNTVTNWKPLSLPPSRNHKPSGHGPGQPAPGDPAWAGRPANLNLSVILWLKLLLDPGPSVSHLEYWRLQSFLERCVNTKKIVHAFCWMFWRK